VIAVVLKLEAVHPSDVEVVLDQKDRVRRL